jgi:hypothetical protein
MLLVLLLVLLLSLFALLMVPVGRETLWKA